MGGWRRDGGYGPQTKSHSNGGPFVALSSCHDPSEAAHQPRRARAYRVHLLEPIEHGQNTARRECALELRPTRYFRYPGARRPNASPGDRHRRSVPAAEYRGRDGVEPFVLSWDSCAHLRELASSLQGATA